MKSAEEFRADVLRKFDEKQTARRRSRKKAMVCLPLAAAVLAAGIFVPRLFTGGERIPLALQAGRPAQVHKADYFEMIEATGKKYFEMTEEEQQAFDKRYEAAVAAERIDRTFQEALNGFARDSTLALAGSFKTNDSYCPLSVYYALAMTGAGANGNTEREFLNVLHADSMDWAAEQCRKYYTQHYLDDEDHGVFKLADSLWMDGRCDFKKAFVSTAEEDFFASLFRADFRDKAIGGEIGRWISENTGGLLDPSLDFDVETRLALVNTVYLNAEWSHRFWEEATVEDEFTRADGSTVTASFMRATDHYSEARVTDRFTRAGRPLRNGFRMEFILPAEGVTVQELLQDPETFEQMFYPMNEEKITGCDVIWRLPKFSIDSEFSLNGALQALGMKDAFDELNADLSGISDTPLYLSNVGHGVHVAVDEKGVEAAAYTVIMEVGAAMDPEKPPEIEMDLDRPFLFAITSRDDCVGSAFSSDGGSSILFVGVCGDPTA